MRPAIGSAAIAALGVALWLAGAVVLVRRGVSAAGAVVRRPALVGAALVVLGLASWAAGLYNA